MLFRSCLSQCKGLRNPSDCHTAVASVTSQSHSLHCLRFLGFVVVHCTDQAIVSASSASKLCSRERLNELIINDDLSASPSPKRLKKESISEFEGGLDGNLAVFENDLGIGDNFVFPSPPREVSVEILT